MKTPEHSVIEQIEQISHIALVFSLLTLNI